MSFGPSVSVLIITCSPDRRESTERLRVIIDEMERRSDVEVTVWVLRVGVGEELWPDATEIDALRRWWPAALFDRVALPRVAAALRGLRLRVWNHAASPDVVILDDGLGDRALVGLRRKPVIVARLNDEAPRDRLLEPRPTRPVDIALAPAGWEGPLPAGAAVEPAPPVRECARAQELGDPAQRSRTRVLLDLPVDEPLITGWGADGWIDGPDLFVRALWALERKHGISAHGLWLGLGADPHEVDRLRSEAARCGVADRFHVRSADTEAARICGDAVFLPYRSAGDPNEILSVVASGSVVVTFPSCRVSDPSIVVVPALGIEEAALALAEALRSDRRRNAEAAETRFGVRPWVDRFLEVAGGQR